MDTDPRPLADPTPHERRTMHRAPTSRAALFSPWSARARLGRGVVVDISPNGLCIRTAVPAAVGDQVEIELQPKPGAAGPEVLVRGQVVWTARRPDGDWSMGVALRVHLPAVPDHPPDREPVGALMTEVAQQLRDPGPEQPSPLGYAEHLRVSEPVVFRFVPERRWRRGRGAAILVLLLLLGTGVLCFGFWRMSGHIPTITWRGEAGPGMRTISGGKPPLETPSGSPGRDREPGGAGGGLPTRSSGAGLLSQAQEQLARGDSAEARALFEAVLVSPYLTPVEQFAGRIGIAAALHSGGETTAALTTLTLALDQSEGVPEPWLTLAALFRKLLAAGTLKDLAPLLLRDALEIEPLPAAASEPSDAPPAPDAGRRITVDTAQYLLTVFDGDKPLGVFPVGLGRDDSTPRGEFYVANKISNPDWYDRGRVVKADDPENPLGRRWLGLGGPEGPTSYGIHPTEEPGAIGGNRSRGCIRMRPADAEQVFAWCEIGTPVTIGP